MSKFRGELRSISEEASWGGGEEKRGGPPGLEASADVMTLRRDVGGEVITLSTSFSSCCGGERTWSAEGATGGGEREEKGVEWLEKEDKREGDIIQVYKNFY